MAKRRRDGTYREPKALLRLRNSMTDEQRIEKFREVFDREPSSQEELDLFIEQLTLEIYNAGFDEM